MLLQFKFFFIYQLVADSKKKHIPVEKNQAGNVSSASGIYTNASICKTAS